MLIDYLRYVAFGGRLRQFFAKGIWEYADRDATTGQHLRFASDWLAHRFGPSVSKVARALSDPDQSQRLNCARLMHDLSLSGGPDFVRAQAFELGTLPSVSPYKEIEPPGLEIVIDIDPKLWSQRYEEGSSYEGIKIVYRQAGIAKGHLASGAKLVDERCSRLDYGTICGFFVTSEDKAFALTCGHVANLGSMMLIESERRIWKFRLGARFGQLGVAQFQDRCQLAGSTGRIRSSLDAALVEVNRSLVRRSNNDSEARASVRPIATMLQEEPVRFLGAKSGEALARVAAITIRKSIDLYHDGTLHEINDALMLGHRWPMYFVQFVSRPGDSGAVVRQDFLKSDSHADLNQWQGMILGADESGAYANHAEHLWAWAAGQLGTHDIDFRFEI